MKRSNLGKIILLMVVCGIVLARQFQTAEAKSPATSDEVVRATTAKLRIRNNCVGLLYDLFNEEKNLSKVLIVKRESDDLNRLVKTISATARDGVKRLERMAAADRTLDLRDRGLPPGEFAVREAVSKTRERELLHRKGTDFEFQLLLTQVEALNYGAHLATVAAENESDPGQYQAFSELRGRLQGLYEEVVAQLRKTK